ncbi:amidohydrolase [Yeosuana aromativorans]|uniref:Amidohydrolase n=1 Tax=Yeosuana aromativorans TaxID=288019 RepID=A0A8J3FGD7_9FLAO|nr:amidohydrolase family protein [Yeosuana aromativorans]GGK24605.1 amidohydrolase [Yeosuana aromativorans]
MKSFSKKVYGFEIIMLLLIGNLVFAQNFSQEVKKFTTVDTNTVAIKNVTIIDGTGAPEKQNQTLVFSQGKIVQLGDNSTVKIPKNTLVIDGSNKTVMPGLVMLHEHMYMPSSTTPYPNTKQLPISFPRLYFASGATTIRTCGSIEPYSDLRIKKDIESGLYPGPNIDITAPYLEGKEAMFPQMNELKNPEDAIAFVNYWADQGFTSFKAYMAIDKQMLKAAIDAVHKRDLKITGHLCAITYREAAELGIDNLEHGFFASTDFVSDKKENECPTTGDQSIADLDTTSSEVKDLMQFLIDKKVGITSTLAVLEGFITTQPETSNIVLNAMSPDTKNNYLSFLKRFKQVTTPYYMDKAYENNAKMEKQFYDMGGLLTVGTDPTGNGGTLAGYGTWRTIELLVEADGFTPLEAIKIATLNGAIALGFDLTIGTLEIGKNADVLLIDGDPSKNISDIRKVQYVFRNGVGYDSKKLFESVNGTVGID